MSVFFASAQTKIGYVNTEELMGGMPELNKLDNELRVYQQELAEQGESYMKDFRSKDSTFAKDSTKFSASMKEIKRKEIFDLYNQVVNWNQQMQQMMDQKTQEKLAPVRQKALDAIKAVAKEGGYAYILDVNSVIVGPPGDDVIALVRKKLGITAPPATPANR